MRDNKRRGGGGGGGRNFASLVDMIEVDENFLQYLENKEDIQGESTSRDSNPEPAKKKKFQRSMSINDFFCTGAQPAAGYCSPVNTDLLYKFLHLQECYGHICLHWPDNFTGKLCYRVFPMMPRLQSNVNTAKNLRRNVGT